MKVSLRSVGIIKMLIGQAVLDLELPDGTDVSGLLKHLADGEKGDKLAPYLVQPKDPSGHAPLKIVVNGKDINTLGGRQTLLADGDDVLAFMPIVGG